MNILCALLIKCRRMFASILIFSILNISISFGMNTEELEYSSMSHSHPLYMGFDSDEQESAFVSEASDIVLLTDTVDISAKYVLALQDSEEDTNLCCSTAQPITSLIVGILTCIPQIAVARAVGDYYGSNEFGYFLIGLTFVSQGGIAGWITNEFISDASALIKKVRKNSHGLGFCSMKALDELKYGIAALVLGTLSSCADVYKVYKYNDIKEFAIITLLFDVLTRTLGLYKAFSAFNLKSTCCNAPSSDEIIRERGEEYIELSSRYFLAACKKEGTTNVAAAMITIDNPEEAFSSLMRASGMEQMEHDIFASSKNFGKGWPRKLAMTVSLVFPLSSAIFDCIMAYKGYSLLIDNMWADTALTAFSVIPTASLGTFVILKATDGVFDKIYLMRNGMLDSDYFSVFHPKFNKLLIVGSFIVGLVSSSVGYAIINDNMSDTILAPISPLVAVVGVVSGLIFGTYTILRTVKNYGEEIVKRSIRGTQYIFGALKRLNQVGSSIITSSIESVSEFVQQVHPIDEQEI